MIFFLFLEDNIYMEHLCLPSDATMGMQPPVCFTT